MTRTVNPVNPAPETRWRRATHSELVLDRIVRLCSEPHDYAVYRGVRYGSVGVISGCTPEWSQRVGVTFFDAPSYYMVVRVDRLEVLDE